MLAPAVVFIELELKYVPRDGIKGRRRATTWWWCVCVLCVGDGEWQNGFHVVAQDLRGNADVKMDVNICLPFRIFELEFVKTAQCRIPWRFGGGIMLRTFLCTSTGAPRLKM